MITYLGTRQYPSTAQLQKLFDSSLDVICSIDIDGRFIDVSNAALQIFGYQPEELIGKLYLDFITEKDYIRTKDAAGKIMRGFNMNNFESCFRRKNGTIVPISWSAQWDAREKVMLCIARDISERKAKESLQLRYEKEIKKQNQQLIDILERITDGFFALDNQWQIIYTNTQAEQILGVKKEDYIGRDYWSCFPNLVDSKYYVQFRKARRENTPVHFEAFSTPFNRWFAFNAYPSKTGLSIYFKDVSYRKFEETKRKEYEEKIKQQNVRMASILEQMNQGFLSVDRTYTIKECNKKATELAGLSEQDIVRKAFSDCYNEEAAAVYLPLFEKVFNEQEPFYSEQFCPQSKRWVEISIYPAEGSLSIFFKDINIRKQNEEELKKLSLVAKETENAVIFIAPDRKATWVNAAFTKMTGYAYDEIVGKRPAEVLEGPETDQDTIRYIVEQYKTEQPFQVEILNYRKSGDPFWSEMFIQPLFDANGKLEQFFSIRKDITERKRLEQQLIEERKKLTATAIAAQEKVRSQVGRELHDNVNQVLTSVKLYQELCLSGAENRVELLQKSVALLQNSIDEIRSLSKRLSAPTLGNIKLKDSIKELIDTVRFTNKFEIDLEASIIDKLEIEQELHLAVYRILQEQLTNILKYADASRVEVVLNLVDWQLVLIVKDDGRGFDPHQKSHGIGISNMSARAESMNGTLTINSIPGNGCTLSAAFPLEL
jgi:PAS domain S-box-containing protein